MFQQPERVLALFILCGDEDSAGTTKNFFLFDLFFAVMASGTQSTVGSVDVYEYGHVILFSWDPDEPAPFKLFSTDEVPDLRRAWLERRLSVGARSKVYRFQCFDGLETSLFAKVQKSE